jgi:hypothetical protein
MPAKDIWPASNVLWGMKARTSKPRMVAGVTFIIAGLLVAANGLISGTHAFSGGVSAVVGLCFAGLLLVGAGVKIIHDATHAA